MGRGAWHPRRQDQLGRHSHRAGEGSGGQGADELKLEAVTPKSHPPFSTGGRVNVRLFLLVPG